MTSNRFALLAATALFATAALAQSSTPGSQAKAAPGAVPAQAAPTAPAFKSPEEQAAYVALFNAFQNPATTPEQMEAAVNDFMTKYPTSAYQTQAATIGFQYFQQKNQYDKMLVFGQLALKSDPSNAQVLTSLAVQIPAHVHDTDLDADQRLAEAQQYAQKLLQLADTVGPDFVPGRTLTPDQITAVKGQLQAAEASMGRSALDKKQYQPSIDAYQKAIALEQGQQKAYDLVFLARAQEGLQKYADANASLDQAAVLSAASPQMMQAITTEKEIIKKAQGGGH